MKLCVAFCAASLVASLPAGAQSSSPRPPITGIAKVSVYGSDKAKSRKFYGQLLGFPGSGTTSQHYLVNPEQSIEVDPLPPSVANHLESVAFATPNVEAMRLFLIRNGIQVSDTVKRQTDGSRTFWLKDPEGHRIEFIQSSARAHHMPAPAAKEAISAHILHAGFIVHDRAAEDRFFRDILGFREGWQGGMKDNHVDWIDMQVPDGTDWLEYMIHGPGPVSPSESGVLNHFALGVPSMHEAMDLLEQRGWQSSPREKAQIGRDGKWQLNLYDPDGTRVELMEPRPVEKPCCSPYTLRGPQ